MGDVGLIAILLAVFLLAIGLIRLLGRLIDSGAPDDSWADEPLGTTTPDPASRAHGTSAVTDPGGTR
ncbi:MAG: hypothetical protein ABSA02_14250 [Trebonia sp.]